MIATCNNDVIMRDILIKNNANLEIKEKIEEYTALHIVAQFNYLDIMKKILESGADANAISRYGFTPLMRAAKKGNMNIVELLLNAGADISTRDEDTAIDWALYNNNNDIADYLMSLLKEE